MLTRRVIPSLLVRGGRLAKGVRFAEPRDAGNPATTARAHNAQKADELMLLDIEASKQGRGPDLATVAVVARECMMPLTVGGGVTDLATAKACLASGADKICVTTTALDNPSLITELAQSLGAQAVVLGVDVIRDKGEAKLFDHRTHQPVEGRDWLGWIEQAVGRGAGEIRLMAADREGARSGLDTELFALAAKRVDVPVILEGGAGSLEHLAEAMEAGVEAVAMGTMLVFSDNNIIQLKRYLMNCGQDIRL